MYNKMRENLFGGCNNNHNNNIDVYAKCIIWSTDDIVSIMIWKYYIRQHYCVRVYLHCLVCYFILFTFYCILLVCAGIQIFFWKIRLCWRLKVCTYFIETHLSQFHTIFSNFNCLFMATKFMNLSREYVLFIKLF